MLMTFIEAKVLTFLFSLSTADGMTASESSISISAEYFIVSAYLRGTSSTGASLTWLKMISEENNREVISTEMNGVEKISLSLPIISYRNISLHPSRSIHSCTNGIVLVTLTC